MNPFATALAETAMTEMEQTAAQAAIVGGLVALGVGALVTLAIAWFVLQAIADWKIFTKAGEAGWKSLIPIYNVYVEYEICWTGLLGLVFVAASLVTGLVDTTNASTVVKVLVVVVWILAMILHLMQSIKLSKSFGKGTGFGLVLFFFGPIGRLILGFGSAQYIGPQ
jgi:hypothetical protein